MANERWEIEVFYDGDCPVCRREIAFLSRADRKGKIRCTNIADEGFRAADYGLSREQFMAQIHGRLSDGTWIRGVEVFRRLYGQIGFGPFLWITRLPVIRTILDRAYAIFARNRLRLTGRCSPEAGCRTQ